MSVALAWRPPGRAAHGLRHRQIAIRDLDLGVGLAAKLPHRLDDLGHAAAVRWVVVAQTAAVGIDGQPPDTRDQIAFGDKASALPFFAKAEILKL